MNTIKKYGTPFVLLIMSIALFFLANQMFSDDKGMLFYKVMSIFIYICSAVVFIGVLFGVFFLIKDIDFLTPARHYVSAEQKKEMNRNIYSVSFKEALRYTVPAIVISIFFYFMGVGSSPFRLFSGCVGIFVLSFLLKFIHIVYLKKK